MKVKVDGSRCAGYGLCEQVCPAVFVLDDLGFPQLSNDGLVPPAHEDEASKAIAKCPERAIVVVE